MNSIRVSICTQVLNQTELLRGMIESVIAQTFREWELLIVDDGSAEDVKSVVESFNDRRIRYFRHPQRLGIPFGVNFAMRVSAGEYIGLLAADERIHPEKLAQQVAYMDAHAGVDAVWGLPGNGDMGERTVLEQNMLRAHNRSGEAWLRTLVNLENVPIGAASMLMRNRVMKSLGGMDEKLTIFSDHELYCRFFEAGHVGVVLPYRWAVDSGPREDSVRSQNNDKAQAELAYVREKHPAIPPKVSGSVTVGIPSFNHAHYLPKAVEAVLAQTHPVDEIILLDDGSTDDWKTVVQQFTDPRIKLIAFPENMGVWEAQNQMAFRADGDFYVPLSADDLIEPAFIEKCLAEFKADPWLEFVATQTDFIAEDGSPFNDASNPMTNIPKVQKRGRAEWLQALHGGNHYFGAGMYRTRVLSDLGGWRKQFKVIADYEMYLRLLQRENIGVVEEILTHTRVDGKNHSLLDKERAAELPRLYFEARKDNFMKLMRVVIATPFYELKGFSPYIVSLVETIRLLGMVGIDWRFMELSGDSYVHRARNNMCDQFLADPDATDLFFIDSDMAWNPEAFVKMCLLPDPIIGGSYPVKNGWDHWTSMPKMHEEDGMHHYRGRELGDGTALLEANVLAGGFLRIKRHVLEEFRKRKPDLWYMEPSTDPNDPNKKFTQFFAAEKIDGTFYGEDHWFSKHIRDLGINMMIYPNATISHYGVKGWTGNLDQFLKEKKNLSKTASA